MFTRSIGFKIVRIILSFIILKNLLTYLRYSQIFFGSSAIVPYNTYSHALIEQKLTFLKLPFYSQTFTIIFLGAGIMMCIFFLVGIYKTFSGLLLFFILSTLRTRNVFIMDGSDNVVNVILPFLSIAYSQSLFKMKMLIDFQLSPNWRANRRILAIIASYCFLIQLCTIYFFAAYSKILQPIWLNGTALYYSLRNIQFIGSSMNYVIIKNGYIIYFMTILTLLWEFSFPVLIWIKKVRIWFLMFSMIMHLGILVLMRIDNYSVIMITLYFGIITNKEYEKIVEWYKKIFLKKQRGTVTYERSY